jgi:hypothetical protein
MRIVVAVTAVGFWLWVLGKKVLVSTPTCPKHYTTDVTHKTSIMLYPFVLQ